MKRDAFPTADFYKEAGERIRLLREVRGYSREGMAQRAAISAKFLYEIETGKKGFSAGVLYQISRALEADCDYILTGEERNNEELQLEQVLRLFDRQQAERVSGILWQIYVLCREQNGERYAVYEKDADGKTAIDKKAAERYNKAE